MPLSVTEAISVGFAAIDAQHEQVLRRVDAAVAAVDEPAALEDALAELDAEVAAHFRAEERLMDESGYPARAQHGAAHELFVQDLARLRREVAAAGMTSKVFEWVARRVPEWIRLHVLVHDTPLGAYLARREGGGGEAPPGSRS